MRRYYLPNDLDQTTVDEIYTKFLAGRDDYQAYGDIVKAAIRSKQDLRDCFHATPDLDDRVRVIVNMIMIAHDNEKRESEREQKPFSQHIIEDDVELTLLINQFVAEVTFHLDIKLVSRIIVFYLKTDATNDKLQDRVVAAFHANHIDATNVDIFYGRIQCEVPRDQFRRMYALLADSAVFAGQEVLQLPYVLSWVVEFEADDLLFYDMVKQMQIVRKRYRLLNMTLDSPPQSPFP